MTLTHDARPAEARQAQPEPFYFGPDGELFGLHYRPTGPSRDAGVLLCYPTGHEYIVSHRAYRLLSLLLADAGFHVMRFDYYASGDSAGECEEGTPRRWMQDVSIAFSELRVRAACSEILLVGCRLGATFCALFGASRGDVERMVLWDPVVNGRAYVDEIVERHQDMLRRTHVSSPRTTERDAPRELLGMACGEAALREMQGLDLLSIAGRPARQVLVIESHPDDTTAALREQWERAGTSVRHMGIPVPRAWTWIEDPGNTLVPHQILSAVATWISGRGA